MVPLTAGQGTWRQSGTFAAEQWHVVPNSLPKHLAATLSVKCVLLAAHACSLLMTQVLQHTLAQKANGTDSVHVGPHARRPRLIAEEVLCSPVSAMRMLEEYVDLESGDVVVQNGANSAVGRAVIQFAHAQGITSTDRLLQVYRP